LERSYILCDVEVEGPPDGTERDNLQGFVEEYFAALLDFVSRYSSTQTDERTIMEQSTTMRLMSKALLESNVDPISLSM
jgi:hypothetical protein